MKTPWGRNRRARAWLMCGLLACVGLAVTARQYNQAMWRVQLNSDLLDAVAANQAATVRNLLRAGADPNARLAPDTPTPPVWQRMTATVQRLWRHEPPAPREVPSTALLVAIGSHDQTSQPQLETVRALLEAGADPNAPGSLPSSWTSVDTPLAWAVNTSQPQIVQLLLDKHADPNGRDKDGNPCLLVAASGWSGGQNARTVALLLDHGADANARDAAGLTPLLAAAAGRHTPPAVFKLLLDHGAAVSAPSPDGDTAVARYIVWHHNLESPENQAIFTLLVAHGADLNFRLGHGRTLLMWAAARGNLATVRMLLSHGANRSLRDAQGWTALDWARTGRYRAHDLPTGSALRHKLVVMLQGHL